MKIIKTLLIPVYIIIAVIFSSCSGISDIQNYPAPTSINGFSNPRDVEGELIVNITNIQPLSGDSLIAWNKRNNNPLDQKPTLMLWSSEIKDQTNQRDVKNLECSIEPTDKFEDKENGNTILYWNLSDELSKVDSIKIVRRFTYTDYDYKPNVDKNIVAEKWNTIPKALKVFYTKSEPFLEQTKEIKETSAEIVGSETNPLVKAEKIFRWVRDTMKYVYPPEHRGAIAALKTCKGDCGQYSALFIDLARCAGIPARQQSGFVFVPEKIGYHVWSEIYLPVYGWVPVDATHDDGFLHIDNQRLIASVGMNIPIKHAPDWANYGNSEVENGRVDFMQLVSTVMSGVKADVNTQRIILKSE